MTNTPTTESLTGLLHYLVQDGLLTLSAAELAMQQAAQQNMHLTQYLVKSGSLSSQTIFTCCTNHFDLPIADLTQYDSSHLSDSSFKSLFYRYRVIPIKQDPAYLYLGITDPTDHLTLSAITFHTGMRIRPMLIAEETLDALLKSHDASNEFASSLELALSKMDISETITQPDTEEQDEPIIEFANQLILKAIAKHASDIHIEPYEQYCRIRFRCDGILSESTALPPQLAARLITRLKVMASLNIAERRLPQDGRIKWQHTASLDIRINTCPTLFGEKIVLRLLDKTTIQLDINTLGFFDTQKQLFLAALAKPQGIILVTGPTGSGKTITLYSALHYLNQIEKNISTVEDPVEIELTGINQVSINPKIGLDFPAVLRAFLRQDPDIIMIGEIRDAITATIAIQAAQTGHLVLSTLHTNSAAETLYRLQSLGVSAYNLLSSTSLIIAQRLIRKLCPHCKQPDPLFTTAYQATGCTQCHKGYQGRTAIYELLPITNTIAQHILSDTPALQLLDATKNDAWISLQAAGLEKVNTGITSYAEISRVVWIQSIEIIQQNAAR